MKSTEKMNRALQYFAAIAHEKNVPVGIMVSLSGNFGVVHSLTASIKVFFDYKNAVDHIWKEYCQMTSKES